MKISIIYINWCINLQIHLKWYFPIWASNASSKTQRPSNKKLNTRHKKPSFELLVRVVQATPKTLPVIAVALGCP